MADRAVTQRPTQSQLAATTMMVGLQLPRATSMSGQVSTGRAEWSPVGGCLDGGTWVIMLPLVSRELGQVRHMSMHASPCQLVCTCTHVQYVCSCTCSSFRAGVSACTCISAHVHSACFVHILCVYFMPTLCVVRILGLNRPKSLPSWGLHSSGRDRKEINIYHKDM